MQPNLFVSQSTRGVATSLAVLTEDEKELGVVLVDIGGGTTDIAIFSEGAIRHTAVIPIAGDQITSDVAMALRTPTPAPGREMCDLPDQLLDLGAGGLGVDPGQPGVVQLDFQGFQIDHDASSSCRREMARAL